MSTPPDDEATREFLREVKLSLVPQIDESAMAIASVPQGDKLDPWFAVQLGAMVLLDKPILVLAADEADVSDKLRLIADRIIIGDVAIAEDHERIAAEIKAFQRAFVEHLP